MRKLWKVAKITFLGVVALVVAAIGALLVLRTYRQHVTARALAIHSRNGIDEGMYIRIGGIDQWIQIRGQDPGNPVLLCVHGGPGGTWIPLTPLFVPWEKEFTVVLWDQRGTGKTLETTGASIAETMSVDRMAQDGIEVAEFLRKHLHKDKIILLGHSWGSILGVHMARQRPDLFYAYVGTGQVSNMPESQRMGYEYLLERSRKANDAKTLKALESIGAPPFDSMEKIVTFFTRLQNYEADFQALPAVGTLTSPAPHYSLWDEINRIRGFATIPTLRVYQEMLSTNLESLGLDFRIPIFFFQGADDERTAAPLADEYFKKIVAPHKEIVFFERAGHFAVWMQSDKFLHELLTRVRPLAAEPT